MLVISKDAVRVKVIHDPAMNYMFKEFIHFAGDACKRDRTVIVNIIFVRFFKGRDNRRFPFLWDDALVKGGLKDYPEKS